MLIWILNYVITLISVIIFSIFFIEISADVQDDIAHWKEKALEEIKQIFQELKSNLNSNNLISTIILGGALNERLLSEKLIGHSQINKNEPGYDFHKRNLSTLQAEGKGK